MGCSIRYTFLEISRTSALIRLDGRLGSNTFDNVEAKFTLIPDELTRIPFHFVGIPDIYITVLERPTPDSAILAIGPKSGPEQKS
jgi:hypothetical protein